MLFAQLLANGVQTGALYALIAAGFSLIFGMTRIFHAAHGATFTIAGFVFYECYAVLHWFWPLAALASAVAVFYSFCRLIWRRDRRAKRHLHRLWTRDGDGIHAVKQEPGSYSRSFYCTDRRRSNRLRNCFLCAVAVAADPHKPRHCLACAWRKSRAH